MVKKLLLKIKNCWYAFKDLFNSGDIVYIFPWNAYVRVQLNCLGKYEIWVDDMERDSWFMLTEETFDTFSEAKKVAIDKASILNKDYEFKFKRMQ